MSVRFPDQPFFQSYSNIFIEEKNTMISEIDVRYSHVLATHLQYMLYQAIYG